MEMIENQLNDSIFMEVLSMDLSTLFEEKDELKKKFNELINEGKKAFENACSDAGIKPGKTKKYLNILSDPIKALEFYNGKKSLKEPEVKQKRTRKNFTPVILLPLCALRIIIEEIIRLLELIEKEKNDHWQHLHLNFIHRLSNTGNKIIREFNDFIEISYEPSYSISHQARWAYELCYSIDFPLWGYSPQIDGDGKFKHIPPAPYALSLFRSLLENIIYFRTLGLDIGCMDTIDIRKDGETVISSKPESIKKIINDAIEEKYLFEAKNRDIFLKIYKNMGIIESFDTGMIKCIYSKSSGVSHVARLCFVWEVILFREYVLKL